MKIEIKSPKQAINRHFLAEKVHPETFDLFVEELDNYLYYTERAKRVEETNENIQSYCRDFLSYCFPNYVIDRKEYAEGFQADIQIVTEEKAAVLMVIEMDKKVAFSPERWNQPSFYRLLITFLFERIEYKNDSIKFLIINTVDCLYFFDAAEIGRLLALSDPLIDQFNSWRQNEMTEADTKKLYTFLNQIIAKAAFDIPVVKLDMTTLPDLVDAYRQCSTEQNREAMIVRLLEVYKLCSPTYLLKKENIQSNLFNEAFYYELLHILGLQEQQEGSRRIITRCTTPQIGSLLENIYIKLKTEDLIYDLPRQRDYGKTEEEQCFNVALSLTLTWLNRLLFLKILEAQLVNYNVDDTDKYEFQFLHPSKIGEFDTLNTIFFEVMSVAEKDREKHIVKEYGRIPFLNSSLFEVTDLERYTLRISNIKDSTRLTLYENSILKNIKTESGESLQSLGTLEYLMTFFDAYDFGLSKSESMLQEVVKPSISVATLGLMLERLSGYRAGAFYTPSVVTKYMSRDILRRDIVQKFNKAFDKTIQNFDDVKRFCQDLPATILAKANEIVNSIKICDASVGAGQFLVAALNELLVIKSELGILTDVEGLPLKADIELKIEDDELIIYDKYGLPFSYKLSYDSGFRQILPELQRIQEAIFKEKKLLIEHSLFGVDINDNAVKICRLRLWLELLKSTYYRQRRNTQLETLPNIDINIKTGNSLMSRFGLDTDLDEVFRRTEYSVEEYKASVKAYKQSESRHEKRRLAQYLWDIKGEFQVTFDKREREKLAKVRGKKDALELQIRYNRNLGYEPRPEEVTELERLTASLERRQKEKAILLNSDIFNNAFEWRFEFPEVLDENGNFLGFDIVFGQPTTQPFAEDKEASKFYKKLYNAYTSQGKLYEIFFELGLQILAKDGLAAFFSPNAWLKTQAARKTRKVIDNVNPLQIIYFGKASFQDKQMKQFAILSIQKNTNTAGIDFIDLSDIENIEMISAKDIQQFNDTESIRAMINQ